MKATLFIFLFTTLQATGQSAYHDKFAVNVNTPLTFRYNSIDELSVPKVINNALELQLSANARGKNITAHINFHNVPASDIPSNWVNLKLVNKNSQTAIINKYLVPLSPSPALLFTQPKTTAGEQNLVFYYDLLINPQTTFIRTGVFEYSITFTMTEL